MSTVPDWFDYSVDTKITLSQFYREFNDLQIFIEGPLYDSPEDNEKARNHNKILYKILLSRLFDDDVEIDRIFTMGGKNEVLEAHQVLGGEDEPRIFIVDGDCDFILSKSVKSSQDLIRLDYYCIENLLIDPDSILDLMHSYSGVRTKEQLSDDFDIEHWIKNIANVLVDLFLHFSMAQHFGIECKTMRFYFDKCVVNAGRERKLDKDKVNDVISEIRDKILQEVDEGKYRKKYTELSQEWPPNEENCKKIVSGKDFLLPLIRANIILTVGECSSARALKVSLMKKINLDKISQFRSKIVGYLI